MRSSQPPQQPAVAPCPTATPDANGEALLVVVGRSGSCMNVNVDYSIIYAYMLNRLYMQILMVIIYDGMNVESNAYAYVVVGHRAVCLLAGF